MDIISLPRPNPLAEKGPGDYEPEDEGDWDDEDDPDPNSYEPEYWELDREGDCPDPGGPCVRGVLVSWSD